MVSFLTFLGKGYSTRALHNKYLAMPCDKHMKYFSAINEIQRINSYADTSAWRERMTHEQEGQACQAQKEHFAAQSAYLRPAVENSEMNRMGMAFCKVDSKVRRATASLRDRSIEFCCREY